MANLKFEGNLANISEIQQNYISKVLQERGYKDKAVTFSTLGKAGDNHMANVRRITVENDDGTTFKMIAKISVQDPLTRNTMGTDIVFNNEAIMYTKIFPKFTEMEKVANVPENQRFKYAKCYGSCEEAPYEVILLEDLTESGYQMLDKFVPLSDDNVRLVITDVARYHALSYAWKNEDIEAFEAQKQKLKSTWENMGDNNAVNDDLFGSIEKQVLEWYAEKQYNFNQGIFVKLWQDFVALKKRDSDSEFSIIQHGDLWTNNIVFNKKASSPDCILIDYQMAIPTKPAADLLFLLFTSTIHEQRTTYFQDWIQHYYKSLDTYLNYFGLKASKVLPREQLNADIKDYASVIMRHSILILIFTLRDPSESVEILNEEKNEDGSLAKEQDPLAVGPITKKRLQERAIGLVKTLKQFNLL